jgi:aspartate carbamoyltransferase catalytic subunit
MLVDPSDVPGSRILQQVTNGISVRMAVLFTLLSGDVTATLSQGADS